MATLSDANFEAALKAVETEDASDEEKAEMLMEMAMGIQQKPKSAKQIANNATAPRFRFLIITMRPPRAIIPQNSQREPDVAGLRRPDARVFPKVLGSSLSMLH